MPLLGLAIGAATGALMGSLTDAGISDKFIQSVREKVTPGTSALFLLSAYYAENYPCLITIKAKYDPYGALRFAQSI